jgi:hypothetical protein
MAVKRTSDTEPRRPTPVDGSRTVCKESLKTSALDHGLKRRASLRIEARSSPISDAMSRICCSVAPDSCASERTYSSVGRIRPASSAITQMPRVGAGVRWSLPSVSAIVRGWRFHIVPTCLGFSQREACSPAVDALAIELAKATSTESSAGFSTKVPALKASPRSSMSVAL